jgi:VCBS repeat-containing protein
LIELVKSADGDYVYEEYDNLPATEKTDKGQKIAYVLTVNRITEDGATVTFRVNN